MNHPSASAGHSQAMLLAAFAFSSCVSVTLTVVLGVSLTPADFGFFALVAVVVTLGREVIDLGTTAAAAREIAREPDRERAVLEGLALWRRLAGVVLGLCVLGLALVLDDPARRLVLVATAALMLTMGPTAFLSALLVRHAMRVPAAATIANQALLLATCLLLVIRGVEGAIFGGLVVAREAIWNVTVAVLGRALLGYRLAPMRRAPQLRRLFQATAIYALVVLCQKMYLYIDVLVVLFVRGENELGAYAAAFRVLTPAFLLPGIAFAPLIPLLARNAANARERYQRQVEQTLRLALAVGALGSALGVALGPDLVAALYRGQYTQAPLDITPAVQWLSASLMPVYVTAAASIALLAAGRERVLLGVVGAGFALNLIANLLLVPHWGFHAAAITTAITEWSVCVWVCTLVFGCRRPQWPARSALLPFLPAATAAAVCANVPGEPVSRLFVGLGVGLAALAWVAGSAIGRDYIRAVRAPEPQVD